MKQFFFALALLVGGMAQAQVKKVPWTMVTTRTNEGDVTVDTPTTAQRLQHLELQYKTLYTTMYGEDGLYDRYWWLLRKVDDLGSEVEALRQRPIIYLDSSDRQHPSIWVKDWKTGFDVQLFPALFSIKGL